MVECYLYLVMLGLIGFGKQILTVGFHAHQVSGQSAYEVIIPQRLANKEKRWTHSYEKHLDYQLFYLIKTGNETHILKLKKNINLVGEDFIIYTYSKDGTLKTTPFEMKTHCYYHGIIEGVTDSMLALSTCDGLRGIIHIDGRHYGIEPINGSNRFEHFFYVLENFHQQPFLCGVLDGELFHQQGMDTFSRYTNISYGGFNEGTRLRKRRAVLPEKRYVELYMVVDKNRYVMKQSDAEAVQKETVELVNYVDGGQILRLGPILGGTKGSYDVTNVVAYYVTEARQARLGREANTVHIQMFHPLNIQVVLVGLEIWTNENPIEVNSGSAGDVLNKFVNWRQKELMKRSRNDVSHLIIGRSSFGSTVGMAYVGTVCNADHGGSFSTFYHNTAMDQAGIVAHELGHNLGMQHDDTRCPGSYIMHSSDNGSKNFSSCSSNDFENLILRGGGTCLRNSPKPSDIYTQPVCGNNIVDKNEECDCGTPKECSNPCCDAATCTLKAKSECAEGLCCEKCKFKVPGVECRPKRNVCDLPEYCNGTYPDCPEDVYIMDGHPCNNMKEYCYGGVCQDYDSQCESLFGKGAKKGANVCFEVANSKGDRFGNCGMSGGLFVKCTQANSLCGKLHCTSVNQQNIHTELYLQNYDGASCVTTDFNLGSDVPDPALVHRATACAEGKACVDFKCVNASLLGYNCDIKNNCNDRAVCNNKGNCHCNPGWAPPFCDVAGYGGSIDSGPTHIDTSLRDGLLVFFLLVLPLLILAVIAFAKRDAIEKRLCRECRRRRRAKNAQQARSNNTPSELSASSPVNNRRPTSASGVFTISHFPAQRPPVQSQPGQPPQRPPLRPPIPSRPVYAHAL